MPGDPFLLRIHEALATATLTQRFGCTGFYLEGPYRGCPHFHKGVDIVFAGGQGAPVYSPASGIVVPTTAHGLGNSIEILAPNGFRYILGHMANATRLQVGQSVLFGQYVGEQGSTGQSTGAHVHLQILNPQGEPIDPVPVGYSPTAWPRLWYTLFHSLGAGAGYNPGQSIAVPPDPHTPGYNGTTVPVPLPNGAPATWEFANGHEPGPGEIPDTPATQDPYLYGQTGYQTDLGSIPGLFAFLSTSGGPIGQALAGAGAERGLVDQQTGSTMDCSTAILVLSVAGLGAMLILIGLLAITREKPAQAVIQPVVEPIANTAQSGAKLVGVAAKAGA